VSAEAAATGAAPRRWRAPVLGNLAARIGALASLTVSSLLVARIGGPAGVGVFVLLRVLPWLAGMLLSGGIYGAAPFFLGGDRAREPRFRPTIFAIACVSGSIGVLAWLAVSPLVRDLFFKNLSLGLVALAGITVLTQVLESTSKACSQGFPDLPGANRVIVLEELAFIPAFVAYHAMGMGVFLAIILGLASGDLITLLSAWTRLARKGFFRGTGKPSTALVRQILAFGIRAQVSSIILLLNARLDFAIVGLLVGERSLGIYAIASRFAELLRLPSLAINYVLYPRFAHETPSEAIATARAWIRKVGWIPLVSIVPLAFIARWLLPAFYGQAFHGAVAPSWVLLAGLAGSTVSAIVSAFLYGVGRPGLNSFALGGGLVMTAILDITLIPRFGIMGAAIASAVAYSTATIVLLLCLRWVATRPASEPEGPSDRSAADDLIEMTELMEVEG
jgi:O-antigen/teichoic acid export membrane protein